MRTESGMNNMNMESTSKKARAKNMRRRILASICAVAIALLQCAVIVTVGTEDVHAADGNVTLQITYEEGMTVTKNVDAKKSSKQVICTIGEGDEKVTLKGVSYKSLFNNNGATKLSEVPDNLYIVTEVEGPEDIDKDQYLYKECKKNETSLDNVTKDVTSIEGKTTATAVSFASKSVSPDNPTVGSKATIKYSLKYDKFLKDSNEFAGLKDDITKITWNPRNATIVGQSTKSGDSGTITVKISSKGKVTVMPTSSSTYAINIDQTPVEVTGKDNNLSNASIKGVKDKKANGKAQTQSDFTVVLDGVTLKSSDYTVSYKNNTKPGKATMTVTAKKGGKYSGSKSTTFMIVKETTEPKPDPKPDPKPGKSLNNASISKTGTIYRGKNYTKSEIKEKISVSVNGKTIDKKYWDVESYSTNGYTMTVSIKGKNGYSGGTSSTISVSYSTTKSKHTSTRSTYRTYRTAPRTSSSTTSTGTTVPNVTYAPDRTITVKEVFIGQQIQDEPVEQPTPAEMMDEGWDEMSEEPSDDFADEEDFQLDFGPMAGSAAVAAAACGAGAVGRIRRFKVDTAAEAVKSVKGILKRG